MSSDDPEDTPDVDPETLPPTTDVSSEDATIAPASAADEEQTLAPTIPGAAEVREATVGDQIRYFGDYELLEEIARGGMGVVYKARQTNLNRIVALKMILAGQFAGEEDVQRFYTEAEAAAQLDHPGIVPIFEIGEHQGQHYFSMAYIEGQSLAQKIVDGPLPPREAAELVKKIADAMAYAHEKGVIHRDLKPANILIDPSGQPKVTDFGLAKKTESDSNLTGTGQILGTPAYMPPEQAAGKTDEVGPLADVYSAGAILYCLLSGRPPFQAASPMDTLLQVLDQQPVAPRTLNPRVPQDLNTICIKCLEKDPKRRYDSAADLAADLTRYLNREPIAAKPPSLNRLVQHWIGQNIGAIGWAAVVGAVLGLFFAAHTLQTEVALSLRGIGNELEQLQFPRELHPVLTHLPRTPIWLHGTQEILLIVLLVTAGLFVAALVRPKNRPADVIAGTLSGFCAASVLFVMCFSWLLVYDKLNNTSQDLIEVTQARSGGEISTRLMQRYPSLRAVESRKQAQVAWNLVRYRQVTDAALAGINAFVLSIVICIPSCLCETMLAGWLLRRHKTVRATVIPYLEIGLPLGMIVANLIMHQVLFVMGFVQTSVSIAASSALYIPLLAATIASVKQIHWPWRLLLHIVWIASIVVLMAGEIRKADTNDRERPVLGVAATDQPDRCEVQFVVPESPAARVGLQPGDLITEIDDVQVSNFVRLQEIIRSKQVGDPVTLTIERDGQKTVLTVKLERGKR